MHSSSLIIGWANHPRPSRAAPHALAQDKSAYFVSLPKSEVGLKGHFAFWPDSLLRQPPTLQGGASARRVLTSNNNRSGGVTPSVRPNRYF
jgi:hypothetical protein